MSRLEEGAKKNIKTTQYFTDTYKEIIKERDKSFYDKNKSDFDNFSYVLNRYTGYEYWYLNNYLKNGIVEEFTEKELKSWAYCLHSSLQFRTSNVKNGTVVYRGVGTPVPSDWKVGSRFYFPEFISTTLDYDTAKSFSNGVTILVITIKNNGNDGRNNYCRYIADISIYPDEKEVLITAFCIFTVTKIDGNTYYLDCEGY